VAGSVERDGRSAPPRRAGKLVRELLESRMSHGMKLGRLVLGWQGVVGDQMAAETAPAGLERGELVVTASSSAWAAQVKFLEAEVRRRSNELLGAEVVGRVRVVVSIR